MNYPLIHSLSTVNIVKHYNQDYLFHSERTDFTGNNGVGKSILADLIQLIFISEDKLIEFGTDSLNKEGRSPYTLPKEQTDAFVFMNIEMKKDNFLTIGVCIPTKRSKRLKPFLITNDLDVEKPLDDLCIKLEALPQNTHFISNGNFMEIEQVARHLRDQYGLYLQYYSNKDDKEKYYSFLFQKGVLSVNLSIGNNLKSFARIIQSFSRAKSLNLKDSKSLKDFLFEESEKEYQQLFLEHKSELEKQIDDYKKLDEEINLLEQKQECLSKLKDYDDLRTKNHILLLTNKVFSDFHQVKRLEKKIDESSISLKSFNDELDYLKKTTPRLKAIQEKALEYKQDARSIANSIRKHLDRQKEIDSIDTEIAKLKELQTFSIEEDLSIELDLNIFDTKEIIRKVELFKPVFEQYGSVKLISDKTEEQHFFISQQKQAIQSEIKRSKEVLKLIDLDQKNTLFSKALEQGLELSESQEAVLFHFLNLAWERPLEVVEGSIYTNTLEILEDSSIEMDEKNNGYWFKTGHMVHFVKMSSEQRLFNDPGRLKTAIENRKSEIENSIFEKESKLVQLDRFEKGQTYDQTILDFDYTLDDRLKDYSSLEEFKKTAFIIQHIDDKIKDLERKKLMEIEEQEKLVFPPYFNIQQLKLSTFIDKSETWLSIKEKRADKLFEQYTTKESRIKTLNNDLIPSKGGSLTSEKADLDKLKIAFEQKQTDFQKLFPEIELEYSNPLPILSDEKIDELEASYHTSKENYVSEYKTIVSRFDESKENKNPEVNEQIEENKFSFVILEQVLLGSKIRYMDSISDEVRSMNDVRIKISETIYETMLKIFVQTKNKYDEYKTVVRDLNLFFKEQKISEKHIFQIDFITHKNFSIDWVYSLQLRSADVFRSNELLFNGASVEGFIEDFFKEITGLRNKIKYTDLLDPKTYFELDAKLGNESQTKETPGSTGETYTAIVLLCIGRLNAVQTKGKKGIKFIILEETANLDTTNFSTFPEIARKQHYQIITMTPRPYGSDSEGGWYLHHLIPGIEDTDINYPVPNSFFKTNKNSKDLRQHLEQQK